MLIYVPIAWVIGNALSIPLLYCLAFYNLLGYITPFTGLVVFTLSCFVAIAVTVSNKNAVHISKRHIVLLSVVLLFFFPLIKNSVFSFLIEWDAVAEWFMKAQSFFYSPGIWGNQLFQNSAFLYTERSYPLGGSLLISVFYRLVGFVNDQTVQLYLLFFYLNSVILGLGFLNDRIRNISLLSVLLIVLSFFISPLFIFFSHNGYMDMVIANVFISVVVLYIFLLEDKKQRIAQYLIPITLIAGAGMLIKNEGVPLFILSIIFSYLTALFKYKRMKPVAISGTVLIYPLLAKTMWEYYKSASNINYYFNPIGFEDIRSRTTLIVSHYLNTLQYTPTQGVTLILAFFLLIIFTTILIAKRQYITLLPQLLLLLQLGSYTYFYLVTSLPLDIQLPASFDRLVLQLLPALFVVLVYQGEKVTKIFSNKQFV
ncbi:MAG: hypothetical protein NUV65_02215 [Candidatus Roizmanbacteria bacterium]|nr:hypothetical protein [Candidatus Roizmanbacteria bacterium]